MSSSSPSPPESFPAEPPSQDGAPLESLRQRWLDLQGQVETDNPEHYRQLALYLQVLRDGLLGVTRQACFHLATQVEPLRYAALPASRRRRLHQRLETLVRRTCSLLTVEQLCHLAAQMAEEGQGLAGLQVRGPVVPAAAPGSADPEGSRAAEPEGEDPSALDPPGSVRLGLALPIGSPLLDAAALDGLLPPLEVPLEVSSPAPEPAAVGPSAALAGHPAAEHPAAEHPSVELAASLRELLRASSHPASSPGSDRVDAPVPSNAGALWRSGLLPRDPAQLLRWWGGIERALARRLRNLSHAVNVELLRQGLATALLPLSMLEAVLSGHLEPQPASANLLRLPVPIAPALSPAWSGASASAAALGHGPQPAEGMPVMLELQTVLLRVSDLEHQLPPLRSCRRRLQQQQQRLRTMADASRRLQERLAILEAQQLWQQDITAATDRT